MWRSSNYEICFSLSAPFRLIPEIVVLVAGSGGRATTGRTPHLPQLTASLCNTPGEPSLVMTWIFMKFHLSPEIHQLNERLNAIQWIHGKNCCLNHKRQQHAKRSNVIGRCKKSLRLGKQYTDTPRDELRLKNRSKRSGSGHNDAVESTPSASESIASEKKADWWFRKILNEIGQ